MAKMAKGISFDRMKKTGEDLSTLEINTIVKSEMFATKPSEKNKTALYDLAGKYAVELERLGKKYSNLINPDLKEEVLLPASDDQNLFRQTKYFRGAGIFAFREFSIWADYAIDWMEKHTHFLINSKEEQQTDINLLRRIEVKSIEISRMLESAFAERTGESFSTEEITSYSDEHPYIFPTTWMNPMSNQSAGLVPSPSVTLEEAKIAEKKIYHPENPDNTLPFALVTLKKRYEHCKQNRMICVLEEWKEEFFEGSPIELDLKHKMILHKALDLGTEHIVMQTKISLSGDITTRISEKFAANPHQFVIDMHNSSIDISVNYWEKIFDALVGFVTKVLNKILPG